MTLYRLNRFLIQFPLLKRAAVSFYRLYENGVWTLFDLYFRIFPPKSNPPYSVRSVLHISTLSHKPFMVSRLMRKLGVHSSYLVMHPEGGWLQVGSRGYDYAIPWSLFRPFVSIYYFMKVLRHYDVIHTHFATFLTYDGRELTHLRKMGKLIVVHFRGCDLRQRTINMRLNPDLNICQECDYPAGTCENRVQSLRIALAKRFAELLFVTTPDMLDFIPEAEQLPFIAPTEIDLDAIVPVPKNEGVFRVVTSSNHDGLDGTRYIREAVERLKREGRKIEIIEVHRTPYEQALAIYKSADVYAGKLRMGYYNNANIECMMMGVPCMSYIREEFLSAIPDCPIINTRPETVYDRLKEYLDRPEELLAIGARGPAFVKKYHDPETVVKRYLERYAEALERRERRTP